jgi:drug/metabolite transporter (DMT)-like permease
MVIYVIFSVSGLILFKLGANSSQIGIIAKGILNLQISFTSLIGICCYLGSFIIYLLLISRNTITFFIPVITGIVYILILTASVLILKEKITLISLAGSLLILIGVVLVAFNEKFR